MLCVISSQILKLQKGQTKKKATVENRWETKGRETAR